jgi:hypothetical protein
VKGLILFFIIELCDITNVTYLLQKVTD